VTNLSVWRYWLLPRNRVAHKPFLEFLSASCRSSISLPAVEPLAPATSAFALQSLCHDAAFFAQLPAVLLLSARSL